MTRPRNQAELDRVVGELRKADRHQPGVIDRRNDAAFIAAFVHYFEGRYIPPHEYRPLCHDNPSLGAPETVDAVTRT